MRISTSTNILYERADGSRIPMDQSILACGEAGFKELDFGFAELFFSSKKFHSDVWQQELEGYGDLANRLGISFVQGHGTIFDFCNHNSDYDHQLEMMHRSIQGAQMLGIPWLVVHPSTHICNGTLHPNTHDENVSFFRQLSDYANCFGVGLAIENMWGMACSGVPRYAITAKDVLNLVVDIDRDNVGICWDVEHASIEKLAQADSIRLLGRYIKATHISDETGTDNIHILPYTGLVQWDQILHAFADIGYDHAFSLEIQHFLPMMPLELLPQAMNLAYSVGEHLVAQLCEYTDAK